MQDRNVQYPNRYQLQKVDGTDNIYDLIPAPGTIQNEGTLINKAALLTDATAALFGLGADAVPDDVLSEVRSLITTAQSTANGRAKIVTGSYVGTGTYGQSNPNELTFDSPFKIVQLFAIKDGGSNPLTNIATIPENRQTNCLVSCITLTTSFTQYAGFYTNMEIGYGKKSEDEKTVFWYARSASGQFNESGKIYYYFAVL